MILKVEVSLGNVTGVQIWTLSKGWVIWSVAKCYFMADFNCSAGASQKENHQMELPDDLSCRRKPVECGKVLWGASATLICFSGLLGLWASGSIPVQLGYPWLMTTSGLDCACPWRRRAFTYHTQSTCDKYSLSSLKQRFTNYFYRISR